MFNFRKIDRHANLMNRMGAVRDVDFGERIASGAMSAETYRAAILSCTHCEHPDDCASYLDTSYNNVRQNMERLGIERRPRGGSRPATDRDRIRTLDEQQAMTAVLLYVTGNTLENVAAAVGASTSAVRKHFADAGMPIRPRGRPPHRPSHHGVA